MNSLLLLQQSPNAVVGDRDLDDLRDDRRDAQNRASTTPTERGPWAATIRRVTGLSHLRSPRRGSVSEPHGAPDPSQELSSWCAANQILCRPLHLSADWWTRDAGPFLALRNGSQPLALRPSAFGTYLAIDGDGRRATVDAELAAEIGREAYALYPPLPSRPVGFADLMRRGLRGLRSETLAILVLSLSCGLLALATPLATEHLVDSVLHHSQPSKLLVLTFGLIATAVAIALLQMVRGYALVRLENRLDLALQASLWSRLLSLPTSFFRRFSVGDLSARAMGIQRIQELVTGDLTGAVLTLLAAIASLGILFAYDGMLATVAVLLVVTQGFVAVTVAIRQLTHERRRQELGGRLNGLLHTLLAGLAKLQAGRAEKKAFLRWADRFAENRHTEIQSRKLADFQSIFGEVYASVTILVLFSAMTLALQQGMSVGELLAVHAAFGQFQVAALGLLGVLPTLIGFVPTWERLQPILQSLPEAGQDVIDPGTLRGQVEMRDVSFRYHPDGPQILDRVSIRLEPGKMVALVGPSGSGKSTCLRLLLGFERPESGAILFDGHDVETLDPNALRRQLGVVLQHGHPSVGTIFHNIVGTESATMDDAWWAAEQAGIADEIRAMPMGMFTLVNQRAASFSGGQRQRLLLARAILRRPRIFMLDEATSALDNATQEKVVTHLNQVGATRLVIAHRLSTVRHADQIYVLDRGRVVEQGTFSTLLRQGGVFSRMAARQTL